MNWEQLLNAQRKPEKKNSPKDPVRSPFETDYDRIIFSYPFRRLQDKTQVHPLPVDDFVHTRLSHSLEVSSVGRSLGKIVGQTLLNRHTALKESFDFHDFGAIVAAASLAHDIGNPPFGHSGEQAISDFFIFNEIGKNSIETLNDAQKLDLQKFEGNAQGFRILTSNLYSGLQLTYATLAAFTKYPLSSNYKKDKTRKSHKKFGYFQAEASNFSEIASTLGLTENQNGLGAWSRHPLAFLVEAADDICYSIIDLEDGCRLGHISYDETEELLKPIIGVKFNKEKLHSYVNINERVGVMRALAINTLISECSQCFLDHENELLNGSFDKALTDCIPSTPYLETISKVSFEKIYKAKKVIDTEIVGFQVIPGILEEIVPAVLGHSNPDIAVSGKQKLIIHQLPTEITLRLERGPLTLYEKLLICTDFISGLTDSSALNIYRNLKGIELPKG